MAKQKDKFDSRWIAGEGFSDDSVCPIEDEWKQASRGKLDPEAIEIVNPIRYSGFPTKR